jgi:antitoxin PrlF
MTMKEQEQYIMRVTRKGQVTIPAPIRKLLGVQPNEQVAFTVEEGEVKLQPAQATLEAAYGAVAPLSRPEDFERITEIAHEEQAQRAMGKDKDR